MGNVKWRIERCPVILGDKRAGRGGGGGENVIVISIPTQHLGVLTNSRLNVCAFQIELEFGNDTLGARERTNNNLNPHGWWTVKCSNGPLKNDSHLFLFQKGNFLN